MTTLTPDWLFAQAELGVHHHCAWGAKLAELGSGVYIITLEGGATLDMSRVAEEQRQYWNEGQDVIYIGRAKILRRRLSQFYRHQPQARSPHAGGQQILHLTGNRTVHWAAEPDYIGAEDRLLRLFRDQVGRWPFGNRMRSAKSAKP